MIRQTEIERYLDDWLGNTPMAPADRVVVAVAVRISREKQRPAPRLKWAVSGMRSSWSVIAAAVAVVLMVGALAGYAARREPAPFGGPDIPRATERPTIRPTETPAASPSEPPHGIEAYLSGGVPDGWVVGASGLLDFRTTSEPSMSIELLTNMAVGSVICEMGPEPRIGSTAEAMINALAARPGLVASNLGPADVSGLPGWQVDVRLDDSVGPTCPIEAPTFVPLAGHAGVAFWEHIGVVGKEHFRVITLDVPDGQTIWIFIVGADGPTFDRSIADATTIVANLTFDLGT